MEVKARRLMADNANRQLKDPCLHFDNASVYNPEYHFGQQNICRDTERNGKDQTGKDMSKVALLLLGWVALTSASLVRDPTESFKHTLVLDKDGKYEVYWKYNSTHITFEVHVETRGYVGFGLSPNGNMFPADVVVGWIKNGRTYFKDYHTVGKVPPQEDTSQDWTLLYSEETDQGMVLKFTRLIDTCDDQDIAINNATQRLIYSYHPDDPQDEHSLMYHGAGRRGTKSVALLNQQLPRGTKPGETLKIIELRPNNVIIPSANTTYLCVGFQMPDIGGKHHLIKFEPDITPGNEELLHHLTIQRCAGNHPHLHGQTAECFYDWPKDWPQCPELFVAWATGGGAYYFPEDAGFSLGGPHDKSFYVMQVHYNNPDRKTGVIDSSGIRLYVTPQLRQHDVGSVIIGHQVSDAQVIPPEMPSYISSGYCDGSMLAKRMEMVGISEFKVLAVLQHAHLIAYGIKTRHFRNGTELKPLMDDPYYDFYFQEFRDLKEPVTVKKGDSLRVHCNYKTLGRAEPTFGGLSTAEEMCESFLYVYPNPYVEVCSSYVVWSTLYKNFSYTYDKHTDFRNFMKSLDWKNQTLKDSIVKMSHTLPASHLLVGPKLDGTDGYYYEYKGYVDVDNFTAYVAPDTCKTSVVHGSIVG